MEFERLWREEGLQLPQRHKKRKRLYHKNSSIIRLRPTHPNHVWAIDFVQDKLSNGRSYKMLTILNEFTWQALAVTVRTRMGANDVSKCSIRSCCGTVRQSTFDQKWTRVRASDPATITATSGLVSAWADKAAGNPLVQTSGPFQPSTGLRSLNGKNVIDFDGSRFLERITTFLASGNVAFHMVLTVDAVASAFAALLAVEGVNDFQIDANALNQFDGRLNASGIGAPVNLTGGPFSGTFILSAVFDLTGTGTARIFIADASRGTMAYAAPIDSTAGLHLMTNRSKNAWIDGAVAELVITGDVSTRAAYQSGAFTFDGFSLGSAVALSVLQGGVTASEAVASWGQNINTTSANIQATTQSVITAPAPVWFEATSLSGFNAGGPAPGENYDPSFHEITFIWTVRNNPLPAWSKVSNLVTGWNNPNVAYGKRVAFCFPEPGTYTVDLWAIDSEGTSAAVSASVTVVSADDAYSAANTVVFAQDGNFTGAPPGAQVTSLTALRNYFESRSAPTRVRFKPGEVVTDVSLTVDNGYLTYIDTWVPGSTVELHVPATGFSTMFTYWNDSQDTDITYRDLIMKGGWDPTTETGVEGNGFDFNLKPVGVTALIYDCELSGMAYSVSMSINQSSRFMVTNCRIHDWKHYGLYSFLNPGPNSKFALIGVEAAQNPYALAGGPKENLSNDHGPVRLERAEEVYIAGCDLFSCTGWSGTPPRAANACLRLNSKGYDGTHITIDRTTLEGGYIQLKYDGESGSTAEYPGNFVADKLLSIGTCRSSGFAGIHFGGVTVRNSIFVMPDVATYEGLTHPDNFFQVSPDNAQPGNMAAPMRFYNNSLISFLSNGTDKFFSNGASLWSDFTEENNLHYMPNAGVTSDGAVDMSTPLPGVTPRFAQVRWNFVLESGSVEVPMGGTITIPYSSIGRQDEVGNGPAGATDQAYWQAAQAAGDDQHMINFGSRTFYAELGEMSVSYDNSTDIVITNTSNAAWSGSYHLRLDRKSHLDIDLPAQTQYASPASLPNCQPQTAPGPSDTPGLVAYDDLYGAVRNQPISRGAIRH